MNPRNTDQTADGRSSLVKVRGTLLATEWSSDQHRPGTVVKRGNLSSELCTSKRQFAAPEPSNWIKSAQNIKQFMVYHSHKWSEDLHDFNESQSLSERRIDCALVSHVTHSALFHSGVCRSSHLRLTGTRIAKCDFRGPSLWVLSPGTRRSLVTQSSATAWPPTHRTLQAILFITSGSWICWF